MKICIALGTRPEIIKMSSLIRACKDQGIDYFVVHSGQHYSYSMDKVFFEELELPQCKYNLEVGSASHAVMTARIMERIEPILLLEKPDVILVQGDTNTVFASALVASKLGIRVGHVEAGLRSYDRTMPEETNRVLCDHISDYLFCPTPASAKIALGEGISKDKIHTVGNTIVDAVYANMEIAKKKESALQKYGLKPGEYFLVTAHRPANVDSKERFCGMLRGFEMLGKKYGIRIFYPIHPRARKMLQTHGLKVPSEVTLAEPLSFFEFLQIESGAKLVLTDSGGVQEEACILGVPCVTLRDNTERPETVLVGANMIAGTDPARIVECASKMIGKKDWKNPFGDGKTAERILSIFSNH